MVKSRQIWQENYVKYSRDTCNGKNHTVFWPNHYTGSVTSSLNKLNLSNKTKRKRLIKRFTLQPYPHQQHLNGTSHFLSKHRKAIRSSVRAVVE